MMVRMLTVGCLTVCCGLGAAIVSAQESFELSAPQLGAASNAVLTADELRVTAADGTVTQYLRDPQFDSADGEWLGYFSRSANQVLRWPASSTGNMQIGQVQGGRLQYRYSQMTIRRLGPPRTAARPVLPPVATGGEWTESDFFGQLLGTAGGVPPTDAQTLRLAAYDSQGSPWLVSRSPDFQLEAARAGSDGVEWSLVPVGIQSVRIQAYHQGRVVCISASAADQVSLLPLAQDPRQLWRVSGGGLANRGVVLESALYPGQCLTHAGLGRLTLQPLNLAATQLWMAFVPPPAVTFQPFFRPIRRDVRPNPALPPAELALLNTHRSPLLVLIGNLRDGGRVEQLRIEPHSSQTISLERDAGATIVETFEVLSRFGVWEQQQLVTSVPPARWYDLSVYEEHLQSIAIDRTGKSPNVIEDVNYVPKSVGLLTLPAGADLPVAGQLNVYEKARAANNPGAVRRLQVPADEQPRKDDPLETILKELKPNPPRRSF